MRAGLSVHLSVESMADMMADSSEFQLADLMAGKLVGAKAGSMAAMTVAH